MLRKITDFIRKYPQFNNEGELEYIFCGGTAVRLNQEYHAAEKGVVLTNPRPITDIDIVNLGEIRYKTHSTTPGDMFQTGLSLTIDDLFEESLMFKIGHESICFTNKEVLAALKSLDMPREKDYFDVKRLEELGGIDRDKLKNLYTKCDRTSSDVESYANMFFEILKIKNQNIACKIFQTLPNYFKLLTHFQDIDKEKVKKRVRKHILNAKKTAYEVGCDLDNICRALNHTKESDKTTTFKTLLKKTRKMNYTDFSQYVKYKLLPELRHQERMMCA